MTIVMMTIMILSHCVGVSKVTAGLYRSYHPVILLAGSGTSYHPDVNVVNNVHKELNMQLSIF